MTSTTTARHRVAIAGNVADGVTGRAMCGVVLSIAEMPENFRRRLEWLALQWGTEWETRPERPDRTVTRADGLFFFLDLPQGGYKLQAYGPQLGRRYGSAEARVTVEYGNAADLKPSWTALALPPTGLQGTVTSRKASVIHASVSIRGSAESVFTDAEGRYALTGIEPGPRTLLVKRQGFRPLVQPVLIAGPGQIVTTDINLLRASA